MLPFNLYNLGEGDSSAIVFIHMFYLCHQSIYVYRTSSVSIECSHHAWLETLNYLLEWIGFLFNSSASLCSDLCVNCHGGNQQWISLHMRKVDFLLFKYILGFFCHYKGCGSE
jgi:hypothetical protein